MKIKSELLVPTKGLRKLSKAELLRADGRFFVNDPFYEKCRLVTFYSDAGHLHWPHGRGCETVKGYFVQAVDGEASYVPNLSHLGIASIESHLDPNIKADVILCNVSAEEAQDYMHTVTGAAVFLARRHPSSMVRQELLAMLHVYESTRLNQCEHVSQPIH